MDIITAQIDSLATKTEVDELEAQLKQYTPLRYMKEIKHDLMKLVKREEFAIIQADLY